MCGPWLAPHSPQVPIGPPYAPPGNIGLLGTDHLGRDVLSRVLHGGGPVLLTSGVAALLGSLAGVPLGLAAALAGARRPWAEGLLLRPLDALLALPPVLLLLLVLTALSGPTGVILAVGCVSCTVRKAVIPVLARLGQPSVLDRASAASSRPPGVEKFYANCAAGRSGTGAWAPPAQLAPPPRRQDPGAGVARSG